MSLDIQNNGIVWRPEEDAVTLWRPGKQGGAGTRIEVDPELADAFRLATGDVVAGETVPIVESFPATQQSDECMEDLYGEIDQYDEPSELRHNAIPAWIAAQIVPSERLISVTRVNGLSLEEAEERPFPRTRRHASERIASDRWYPLTTSADPTGLLLDFAAPLGAGDAGVIFGPHGSGLSYTLQAVVRGVLANAPNVLPLVLLLRTRGEEATMWRRRFPEAEIVVGPTLLNDASPEQTLQAANLVLECALRQTELGHDVLLAVDSLTGLWAAMLEVEGALDQSDADQSHARHQMREWMQRAGCFRGEGLLGSGLGGSLTLVGTLWHQEADADAEEDRELHPHLRLLEQILHVTSWRVPLSAALAGARLYPAIDALRCTALQESHYMPQELHAELQERRGALARLALTERYTVLANALDRAETLQRLLALLPAPPPASERKSPFPF